MSKRNITWDKQALNYFRESIRYIRKGSAQNADKVKKEILEKINNAARKKGLTMSDDSICNKMKNYHASRLDLRQ